jgi:hypothetical protein
MWNIGTPGTKSMREFLDASEKFDKVFVIAGVEDAGTTVQALMDGVCSERCGRIDPHAWRIII